MRQGLIGETQVSIIIPAFNEARVIGKCLDSLTRLDFPPDHFEVILVDNGSADATVEIAKSFADRLNLTVLQKHGVKISALRNLGANAASGAILAFLDADCLPPPSWLTDILALAPKTVLVLWARITSSLKFHVGRTHLACLPGSAQGR